MVYTTWAKGWRDYSNTHLYWESFTRCGPLKYCRVILHRFGWTDSLINLMLFICCLIVHCRCKKKKSPIYSQQVVLKIRWPTKTWLHAEYMMKKKKVIHFSLILVRFNGLHQLFLALMFCYCYLHNAFHHFWWSFFFCLFVIPAFFFFFIKFCFSSSSLPNRPFLFTALDFQFHQFLIIKKNKDWLNCVTLDHTYLRMS